MQVRALPALLVLTLTAGTPLPHDDEPMTMALLSYADPSYLDRLREVARPDGWGLTYAWDAYQDGSVNPESTAYAITTALVLQAFLDAGEIGPQERAIAERWSRCCFTDGFYWYSDQPSDAIFTPNVTSMMASVMYRLGYREQATEAFEKLFATAKPGPIWAYSDVTRFDNDLLHHTYTVWGIEAYREAGGSVPWPREQVARTVAEFNGSKDDWQMGSVGMRRAFLTCFAPDLWWPERVGRATLTEQRHLARSYAHVELALALEASGCQEIP